MGEQRARFPSASSHPTHSEAENVVHYTFTFVRLQLMVKLQHYYFNWCMYLQRPAVRAS